MDQSNAAIIGGDPELAASDETAIDEILDSAEVMVLAASVDGNVSAAPLYFVRDQLDLLFFCSKISGIAAQIAINPFVQAVIWPHDPKVQTGVEMKGHCRELRDPTIRDQAAALLAGKRKTLPQPMGDPLGGPDPLGCFRLRPTRLALVNPFATPRFAWHAFPQNQPTDPVRVLQAFGGWMRLWVRAVRAPFFTAAVIPVLLAGAIARGAALRAQAAGDWPWLLFLWTLIGAVLAAAGTNLMNDYGDYRSGADDGNQIGSNPFTGGSRTIQLGLLAPWKVLVGSVSCFTASVAIGLWINALIAGSPFAPTPLLAIGILGCALGVTYTVGPFRLSYLGFGEIAVALGFGPIIVLGASYVLTAASQMPWPWLASLLASLPVAVFIMLVLWINQFQDGPADAASNKRNWVVRIAQGGDGTFRYERVFAIYRNLNFAGFGLIAILGALGTIDRAIATPYAWLGLAPLPLFLIANHRGRQWVARWRDPTEDHCQLPFELLGVNALTILVHLSTGLLLALGYWLAGGA